jgi:hypothetical protein
MFLSVPQLITAGKAALGLATELQTNISAFKGSRVLFLHTGGIFGAMDVFNSA